MGLSGRKVKQRIPNDPRNLSWADDAARFGSNYLSKFGWDSSKGLGAEGDGMKSHIKVSHKLDMLGIGAGHTKDPNGIAWKQNKDFENLLRRLNDNIAAEKASAGEEEKIDQQSENLEDEETEKDEKRKRKHKRVDEDSSEHIKKKKKKEPKVQENDQQLTESLVAKSLEVVEEVKVEVQRKPIVPRHRAHRARAIAAKNISSKSAAHISEILGVAPDTSIVVEECAQSKLTSVMDTDALGVDKITTSTKSVADYFKDKLLARTSQPDSATPSSSNSVKEEDDAFETPRMGLGTSRFQMELHSEVKVEEATQRMGLSKFSALMSSSFLASASSISSFAAPKIETNEDTAHISEVGSDEEPTARRKKEKKISKKRSKEVDEREQSMEDGKKKKGKNKGKNKEIVSNETVTVDEDEDGDKRDKKTKKTKTAKLEDDPQNSIADDEQSRSTKKDKRKSKDLQADDGVKKTNKDKKKRRTSSEDC